MAGHDLSALTPFPLPPFQSAVIGASDRPEEEEEEAEEDEAEGGEEAQVEEALEGSCCQADRGAADGLSAPELSEDADEPQQVCDPRLDPKSSL